MHNISRLRSSMKSYTGIVCFLNFEKDKVWPLIDTIIGVEYALVKVMFIYLLMENTVHSSE